MEGTQGSRSTQYDRAREAFNSLDLDDRLMFIVQESASMAVQVLDRFVDTLRKECASVFDSSKDEEGAPKPEAEES